MTKGVHPFAHDVEIIYLDNTFLLVYVTKSLEIFSSNGTSCIKDTYICYCVRFISYLQSRSIIHKYRVYLLKAWLCQNYIRNSTTWHCDPEPSWLSRNEEMGLIFSKAKQNGDALIWYTLYLWIIDGDWRVGYKTHAITNVCILYTRCAVRRKDS